MRGSSLFRNGTCVVSRAGAGEPTSSQRALAEQQSRVTEALESFADNTMRYLREEGRLLSEGIDFPPLRDALSRPARARRRPRARATSATCGSSARTSATSSRC